MKRRVFNLFMLALLPLTTFAQDKPAPHLKLKDLGGREISLSDYKGKVVLINFWATWCAPCRAEMPDLIKWQRQYRRYLQVIGVTYPPHEAHEVRQLVRKLKINYPIALGTEDTKLLFDSSDALPVTVVIDREGKVREVIQGILLADEFDEKIKPLFR